MDEAPIRFTGPIERSCCRCTLEIAGMLPSSSKPQAIVCTFDTGSMGSAIRDDIAVHLGLREVGRRRCSGIGESVRAQTYPAVEAQLFQPSTTGPRELFRAELAAMPMNDALLIGMDLLERSTFLVDRLRERWEWTIHRPAPFAEPRN